MDLEYFDLNRGVNYSCEKEFLHSLCELTSTEMVPVWFNQLRHECPNEKVSCIRDRRIGRLRGCYHQKWIFKLLKQRSYTIRRISRVCVSDKSYHAHTIRVKRLKSSAASQSRNTRVIPKAMREKVSVKLSSSEKRQYCWTWVMVIINGLTKNRRNWWR